MRNLKKVLSLSLAFLMVFGLMSFATAKTFEDALYVCSDNELEAIDVLSEIGVVRGTDSAGTMFNPTGTVDRASLAKMMYVAMNGGNDDGAIRFQNAAEDNPFADVSVTYWGYGYCVWAQQMGYISGRSVTANGIVFDPKAEVTLIEAAKMLLCMLGYDKNQLGFDGSGWQANIAHHATSAGLFISDFDTVKNSDTLNRAQAALLVFTAINKDVVDVSNSKVVSRRVSFMQDQMNIKLIQGTVVANDYYAIAGSANSGYTTLFIQEDGGTADFENYKGKFESVKSATGRDFLGRDAYVYVSTSSNSVVYGSLQISSATTAAGTYNEANNTVAKATGAGIAAAGTATKVPYYRNYGYQGQILNLTAAPGDNSLSAWHSYLDKVTYVMNADGVVLRVFSDYWRYGEVTAKSTDDGTLTVKGMERLPDNDATAATAVTFIDEAEGVEGFDDVAEEDPVMVYILGDLQIIYDEDDAIVGTESYGVYAVEKAETVTGSVTQYHSNGYVRIGGKNYDRATSSGNPTRNAANLDKAFVTSTVGSNITLVLDRNGIVVDVKDVVTAVSAENYCVVLDTINRTQTIENGNYVYDYYATVLLDDGNSARIRKIASVDGTAVSASNFTTITTAGTIYAWSESGDKLALNSVSVTDSRRDNNIITEIKSVATPSIAKNTSWLTAGSEQWRIDSDSKIFLRSSDGTWSYVSGIPSASLTGASGTLYMNKRTSTSSALRVVLAVFSNAVSDDKQTRTMVNYVGDVDLDMDSDGNYFTKFNMADIENGETGVYESIHATMSEALAVSNSLNANGVYEVKMDSSGRIVSATRVAYTDYNTLTEFNPGDGWYKGWVTYVGSSDIGVLGPNYDNTKDVIYLGVSSSALIIQVDSWVNGKIITLGELTAFSSKPSTEANSKNSRYLYQIQDGKVVAIVYFSASGQNAYIN